MADRPPSHRRAVFAAAVLVLSASAACAQMRPVTPGPSWADGFAAMTAANMAACVAALRRTGGQSAQAEGVSCHAGTTTHPERVGYCLFRPASGEGLPMLELFAEPATYVAPPDAAPDADGTTYDTGIAARALSPPGTSNLYFFGARDALVASRRLTARPLAMRYDLVPREPPGPVRTLLRAGNAVRDACFSLSLRS